MLSVRRAVHRAPLCLCVSVCCRQDCPVHTPPSLCPSTQSNKSAKPSTILLFSHFRRLLVRKILRSHQYERLGHLLLLPLSPRLPLRRPRRRSGRGALSAEQWRRGRSAERGRRIVEGGRQRAEDGGRGSGKKGRSTASHVRT